MSSIVHMSLSKVLDPSPIQSDPGHHLFKVKSYFFIKSLEEAWKQKQEAEAEAEAEAVDGRLKEVEAEVKEKFTAVASLHPHIDLDIVTGLWLNPIPNFSSLS